ncbi:MAG: thiamine diphosphokinase [Calditrichaceae bacterium]
MAGKIIAIIANGESLTSDWSRDNLKDASVIIAADGGAHLCSELDIHPDYIVGDMDSISDALKVKFSDSEYILRPDQNSTDLQKSIDFAISLSPVLIKIFSSFGKRIDHTIANILLFQDYETSVPLVIYDNFGRMSILSPGRHSLRGRIGMTVSMFSLNPIKNLVLEGFRYPVNGQSFSNTFIGVSNVYEKELGHITFDSGKLFLYEMLNNE